MKPLSLTLTTLLTFSGIASAQSWNTYSPKPNDWYNYMATVAEQAGDNQIFSIGGETETSIQAGVYRYHQSSFWSGPLTPMPSARSRAGCATGIDGRIYVIGGRSSGGGGSYNNNQVWAYDPDLDTWDTSLTPMPTPRADSCAVAADDGWIYVFGGRDNSGARDEVERYNPLTDVWESFPDMAFPRYAFGAVAACDGFIYLFGGETGSGQSASVEVFNPGGGFLANNQHVAAPCAPMIQSRTDFGCAVGRNGWIYIMGGNFLSPVGTSSVHCYNPWTNSWTIEPDMPTSRNALQAVGLGSRVWALGGYRKIWPTTATLEAYGTLWQAGSCLSVVPALPPTTFGGAVSCDIAHELHQDGGIIDIGLVDFQSAWVEIALPAGEIIDIDGEKHDQNDQLTAVCYDGCGTGQVLAVSNLGSAGQDGVSIHNPGPNEMEIMVELRGASALGNGVVFDMEVRRYNPDLGAPTCTGEPNSTGVSGQIRAAGDVTASENDLTLYATDLPTGKWGYFVASQTPGFIQHPGGSQGNLCMSGQIARFTSGVANSGNTGEISYQVNLNEIPTSPSSAILPGETWYFQLWHRDNIPQSTSNFTGALEVTFQ